VGAQIGIHNPQGKKVGTVSRLRNIEYVVLGADAARIALVADRFGVKGEGWRSTATSPS
jgi:adenine-specific DNA-methyltransferase